MKLLIGLGNYPPKYHKTRHNFGFLAVDHIVAQNTFTPWRIQPKFHAQIATGEWKGEKAIAAKPETFMNLSGKCVASIARFYKVEPTDILVFSDDLDQDFGKTRFREKGSCGGQKGLRDIAKALGTDAFARLKFGINAPHRAKMPTDAFVTSKFLPEEWDQIPAIIEEGLKKISR